MTDRANLANLQNLVRDAVRSQRLDDDARDVARLLAVQFRTRARQAQEAAQSAGTTAARVATETAIPAARRASSQASRRAEPVVRKASQDAATAARSVAASPAGRAAAVGATAGAVASILMGGAILAARRAGVIGEAPPGRITERGARKAAKSARKAAKSARKAARKSRKGEGDDSSEASKPAGGEGTEAGARVEDGASAVEGASSESFDLPAAAAHIMFGMALGAGFGAAYSALPREWRAPLPTVGESVAFATAVWATSYAGVLPALGLMPPPTKDEPGRPLTMIAAHWIFGAALGAGLVAGLHRRD